MKKLVLFAAVLMVSLFSINPVKAQVNLNINIGQQPVWGPIGYDHVDYYYFPDIDAYYYVPSGQYIFSNGSNWVWANRLPAQYGNFDVYRSYKVVINKPKPYLQNNIYANQYRKYKNYSGHQAIIKDSRDSKYYIVQGHPNNNGNGRATQTVRKENYGSSTRTIVVNKRVKPQTRSAHNKRPERFDPKHANDRR